MATNDELMATIDAKLSALLKLTVEGQSDGVAGGPSSPVDLAAHGERLLAANGPLPPAAAPPQPVARPLASESDVVGALDEVARLLAQGLKRKRDLADVVADLDSVGFDRARIGELLGISPSHVDAALVAYDRRTRKKRRR